MGGGSGSTAEGVNTAQMGSLPDLFSNKRNNFELEFAEAKPAQQMTPGYKARGGRRY